jgi:hypothetical protein
MRVAPIVVLTIAVAVAGLSAQSPVRAGRWEVVMQMDMPNMPIKMPEMKSVQCVTPEQAKDPTAALPRGPQDGRGGKNDCKVSDYKQSGNTATWQMTCTTPQPMKTAGEMTFADDSYKGTMKMESPQGPMTMKVAGTRVGDCTQ